MICRREEAPIGEGGGETTSTAGGVASRLCGVLSAESMMTTRSATGGASTSGSDMRG